MSIADRYVRFASITLLMLGAPTLTHAQSDAVGTPKNTVVFERIFNLPRIIPAERIAEVAALPAGESLTVDRDGDGKVDEIWYMATDYRHNKEKILVCAVDEDGDYAATGRPDRDSDLYFWDWDADGYIDVVSDYQDDDGDNDVDQMGLFYNKNWKDGKDDMTVWWAVDIGDDNLLWYDVNGTYYQPLCQWRTHFSGDELFYQFRLTEESEHWVNVWEDPFAFYDPDGDQASEVVVRISAIGEAVKNLRYSIDADDDAYGKDTHNYDFSVTALPPEEGLSSAAWHSEALDIRGVMTLPVVPWDKCMEFGQQAKWGRAMLTWDEINSNTDETPEDDPHERWEGILNAKSKHGDFEQVGGPPSSPFNKRVEVTADPVSPLALYFDEVDQRLHLLGADYGYMDVDFNHDGVLDAAYTWKDSDNDGKLDVREADVDGDCTVDFTQQLAPGDETYALTFEALPSVYKPAIARSLEANQAFIDVALSTLGETPEDVQAVIDYFQGPLLDRHPETGIGQRIQNTPAGARFYTALVRDRLFVALKSALGNQQHWGDIEALYLEGHIGKAAEKVSQNSDAPVDSGKSSPLTLNGQTYTKRIPLTLSLDKTSEAVLQDHVVSIPVADLVAQAADFNPDNCVVVSGDYWLTWREIPHQVDNNRLLAGLKIRSRIGRSEVELGSDYVRKAEQKETINTALASGKLHPDAKTFWSGVRELSFLADLPTGETRTYYIYYVDGGKNDAQHPKLTNAVLDNPAYVAWESDAGAFRFYTGQFDFFGKQIQLLPPEERLIYPLIDVNYHTEQDWGIDALHVGKTSGLGGLTIYHDGKAYPVQSPAGEGHVTFEHKVLGSGPVRAGVEIIASNVFPDMPEKKVILRCLIYAGHTESEVNVILPDGLEGATVGIGLMDLAEGVNLASPGTLGVWGRQGDDIGDIGLAVTTAHEQIEVKAYPEERHLIAAPDGQHFRYWIRGGWRRGMQYPTSYDVQNWEREVGIWSDGLRAAAKIDVASGEDLKK